MFVSLKLKSALIEIWDTSLRLIILTQIYQTRSVIIRLSDYKKQIKHVPSSLLSQVDHVKLD